MPLNKIKRLFGITFLLLVAQYVICIRYVEFYPAIMMPAFSYGRFNMDDLKTVEPEIVVTFSRAPSVKYNHQQLLSDMPRSLRTVVTHYAFEQPNENLQRDTEYMTWLGDKLTDLSGRHPRKVAFHRVEKHYRFHGKLELKNVKKEKVQELTF